MNENPIIRWLNSNRRSVASLAILTLFVGVGIFWYGHDAHAAYVADLVDLVLGSLMKLIVWFLGQFLTLVIAVFLWIAQYNEFVTSIPVAKGWVVIRDTANMFFVVILLVHAVGTIFGSSKYTLRSGNFLRRFILVAILVNFSRTLCGLAIDASQVVMLTFIGAIANVGGGNFAVLLGMHSYLSYVPAASEGSGVVTSVAAGAGEVVSLLAGHILAIVMMTIANVVVIVMTAFVIVRIIAFWFLIVFSPLAAVLSITPKGEEYYRMWWKEFFNYLVAGPAMAFCLWLSFAVVSEINKANNTNDVGNAGTYQLLSGEPQAVDGLTVGGTIAGSVKGVAGFGFGIGMLMMSLAIGSKMGGAASGFAAKASKKVTEYTYGKPMKWAGEKATAGAKKIAGAGLSGTARLLTGAGRWVQTTRPGKAVRAGYQELGVAAARTPLVKWFTKGGRKELEGYSSQRLVQADEAREAKKKALEKAGKVRVVGDAAYSALETNIQNNQTKQTQLRTDEAAYRAAGNTRMADGAKIAADALDRVIKSQKEELETSARDEKQKRSMVRDFEDEAAKKESEAQNHEFYSLASRAASGLTGVAASTAKFAATGGANQIPSIIAIAERQATGLMTGANSVQADAVKKEAEKMKNAEDSEVLAMARGNKPTTSNTEKMAAVQTAIERKLVNPAEIESMRQDVAQSGANAKTLEQLEDKIKAKYAAQSLGVSDKDIKKGINTGTIEAKDIQVGNINATMAKGLFGADDSKRSDFYKDEKVKEAFHKQAQQILKELEDANKQFDKNGELTKEYKEALKALSETSTATTTANVNGVLKIDNTGAFTSQSAKKLFSEIAKDPSLTSQVVMSIDPSILADQNSEIMKAIFAQNDSVVKTLSRAINDVRRTYKNDRARGERFEAFVKTGREYYTGPNPTAPRNNPMVKFFNKQSEQY